MRGADQGRAAGPDVLGDLGPQRERRLWERTKTLMPGRARRGLDGASRRQRAGASRARRGDRSADRGPGPGGRRGPSFLRCGAGDWVEAVCPQTRGSTSGREASRRAGRVRHPDRRAKAEVRGAGRRGRVRRVPPPPHRLELVGRRRRTTTDGQGVGGTSSTGINDPPSAPNARSGSPASRPSPARSSFDGLEGITFDDGSWLAFAAESRAQQPGNADRARLPPTGSRSGVHGNAARGHDPRQRDRRHGAPRRPW